MAETVGWIAAGVSFACLALAQVLYALDARAMRRRAKEHDAP